MKVIKKILEYSYSVLEITNMVIISVMTLIITGQVICRDVFKFTPGWSEEVALMLLVWCTILGFAIGVKKYLHLSIVFFVNLLPKKIQNIIDIMNNIWVIFFGYIMAVYGKELVNRMGGSTLAATQWSGSVVYIMIPISGVFIVLYSLANIFRLNETSENDLK
jgi:TRAP-type C4-dicarboxylate transport system permease small subunit